MKIHEVNSSQASRLIGLEKPLSSQPRRVLTIYFFELKGF